jgi:hypothetical protein
MVEGVEYPSMYTKHFKDERAETESRNRRKKIDNESNAQYVTHYRHYKKTRELSELIIISYIKNAQKILYSVCITYFRNL